MLILTDPKAETVRGHPFYLTEEGKLFRDVRNPVRKGNCTGTGQKTGFCGCNPNGV
jgi:hypothetical protein